LAVFQSILLKDAPVKKPEGSAPTVLLTADATPSLAVKRISRASAVTSLKQQAVTMVVEDNFGVSETARRLSIPLNTSANWVAQCRQDKQGFAAKPGVGEQQAEPARLRKENVQLRMERDILKKRRLTLPGSRREVC
jgi:transposase